MNANLSKMFGAKNHIHFLPQNTFPQTPNLNAAQCHLVEGLKILLLNHIFFCLEFVLMSCV